MDDFTKLQLSTETIRELTDDELAQVNGGVQYTGTTIGPPTQNYCPSGRTWTMNCNMDTLGC
jgi:bacteriocin-like protein